MNLTIEIKRRLASRIAEDKFKEAREANIAHRKQLADNLYYLMYPVETALKMNRLPDEAFHSVSCVKVRPEKDNWRGELDNLYMSQSRKVFAKHQHGILVEAPENFKEIKESERVKDELHSRQHKLKDTLFENIRRVTTLKKLLEVWPEAEPYLEKIGVKEGVRNLPAVVVEPLGSILEGA